jgi:endonuclease G, mitochondrial
MTQQDAETKSLSIDSNYASRAGYDALFLGSGARRVGLPTLSAALRADAVKLGTPMQTRGRPSVVLKYHHFSIVMSKARRLAHYTAVNIDGTHKQDVTRESDKWVYDPRIARDFQLGAELYEKNDLDYGHLVRRLDACWGDSLEAARQANDDTFHFTNCSPQHKLFNRNKSTWAGMEDYILTNAIARRLRVTVFTGPVFDPTDKPYRNTQLPAKFWKVVAMVKQDGTLSATAYMLEQTDLLATVEKDLWAYGPFKTYQVSVREIERLTGLGFGDLPKADPLDGVKDLIPHELVSADQAVL